MAIYTPMLSFSKIAIALFFIIIYYILSLSFIKQYLPPIINQPNYDLFHINYNSSHKWISYGSFAAIPYFYKKSGYNHGDSNQLITVASICDIDLLYEAHHIAFNYKTGPFSLAIYIDTNYLQLNITKLYNIIFSQFKNITSLYDITIGIVAINISSYSNGNIRYLNDSNKPLIFKIPTNVLRNLAEYQVETNWIFNIDIDFWFMSNTLNNKNNIASLIYGLNSMISENEFGIKTVFVVPAFEINSNNYSNNSFEYSDYFNSLSKRQLIDLIYLEDISAFHDGMMAQKCTNYYKWYDIDKPYVIKHKYCHYAYEPWFIIHRNVSRYSLYEWDNKYIGRGLNKVSRVFKLRHFCFNFIVMHNLFIIHAPDSMVLHHDIVTNQQKEKWHKYNLDLFNNQTNIYLKDKDTCIKQAQSLYDKNHSDKNIDNRKHYLKEYITNIRQGRLDLYCENGVMSDGMASNHCRVCCPKRCTKCGGRGCGKINPLCCTGTVIDSGRYCNESSAPCQLTLSEYCEN
eukprot:340917_1